LKWEIYRSRGKGESGEAQILIIIEFRIYRSYRLLQRKSYIVLNFLYVLCRKLIGQFPKTALVLEVGYAAIDRCPRSSVNNQARYVGQGWRYSRGCSDMENVPKGPASAERPIPFNFHLIFCSYPMKKRLLTYGQMFNGASNYNM
jgi:hypothetical protein